MKSEPTTSQNRKISMLVFMAAVLTLVYIFGASPYAGTFGTLQAQGSNGAITGLTLTSDAPGTLTVSWDAASPVPTDYRVDWAKSDEDYQSWKVDDGHKYPVPAATTVTIADLEHDTGYKIRMRARYYRDEHEGKSWGGPWATETITVTGEPAEPAEPAETPTPEPVAEEPVKKDSAKKGSGNQRPPRHDPPQEDTTSVESALVSNLEQIDAGTDNAIGPILGTNYEGAISFTTGDSAFGYHMTSAQLYMELYSASHSATAQISIRGDNAGVPGGTVLHTLTTSAALTDDLELITFTTPDEVRLQPTTVYWLQVSATEDRVIIGATASGNEDGGAQDDWRIGDRAVSREDEGAWNTASAYSIFQIKILGHDGTPITESVSEPAGGDVSADIYTAGRLAVDGSVTGRNAAYDVDWFVFSAEVDANYQFTANPGEKGLPYYTLRIFNGTGDELRNSLIAITVHADGSKYYSSPDRRNVLPFQTDTPGTYFVSIEPVHGNSSTVAYTLAMSDDDYPADVTSMGVVHVGGSAQNYVMRTSAVPEDSGTADVDWIYVVLDEGVTYEIVYDVACLHQGIIVGIYGGSELSIPLPGTPLSWPRETKGFCTDLTTEFTASSGGGDYYIAVSAEGSHFRGQDAAYPLTGVHGTLSIKVTTP